MVLRVEDHDVAGRLKDPHLRVKHLARDAARETACLRVDVLWRSRGISMVRQDFLPGGSRRLVRNLAIRRIDDTAWLGDSGDTASLAQDLIETPASRSRISEIEGAGILRVPVALHVRLTVGQAGRLPGVLAGGGRG
jgi:hypothetical protein